MRCLNSDGRKPSGPAAVFETSATTDAQEKDLHFGFPWQDNVVVATDPVTEINTDYGAPGDIWLGPMHMHKLAM